MKCKQHPCDLSSNVGVCSSCLRHRLLVLVHQQHHQSSPSLHRSHSRPASSDPPHKSDSQHLPAHPPLIFPRSVSPYVARRKSHGHSADDDADDWSHHHLRFLSTPQLGPTYSSTTTTSSACQRKYAKLSLLANFFRSRSDKLRNPDLVPASSAHHSGQPSSSSWFSSIFPSRRKKQRSIPESLPRRRRGRGMSPADFEECDPSVPVTGSCDDQWESKRTPISAKRGKARNISNSGNINPAAGFAFCLSPLVRASPNPHWNQKGTLPPDLGEVRVAVKPNLSTAASFCANRSRKLADLGRR
ncbi:hypothetical protein LINPERPRIM_LOCUS27999 [Linum perenne]